MERQSVLNQSAELGSTALDWTASPLAGVERHRLLDLLDGENAQATTIVRYAPCSRFERRIHGGDEEILVVEGTFRDEYGDYVAGSRLSKQLSSSHAPFSEQGCTILVKLRQMQPAKQLRRRLDTTGAFWLPDLVSGLEVQPLHAFGSEHAAMVRWELGVLFQPYGRPGGEEIFVLEGVCQDGQGNYQAADCAIRPAARIYLK